MTSLQQARTDLEAAKAIAVTIPAGLTPELLETISKNKVAVEFGDAPDNKKYVCKKNSDGSYSVFKTDIDGSNEIKVFEITVDVDTRAVTATQANPLAGRSPEQIREDLRTNNQLLAGVTTRFADHLRGITFFNGVQGAALVDKFRGYFVEADRGVAHDFVVDGQNYRLTQTDADKWSLATVAAVEDGGAVTEVFKFVKQVDSSVLVQAPDDSPATSAQFWQASSIFQDLAEKTAEQKAQLKIDRARDALIAEIGIAEVEDLVNAMEAQIAADRASVQPDETDRAKALVYDFLGLSNNIPDRAAHPGEQIFYGTDVKDLLHEWRVKPRVVDLLTNFARDNAARLVAVDNPHLKNLAATFYANGIGVDEDEDEALRIFRELANANYVPAKANIVSYVLGKPSTFDLATVGYNAEELNQYAIDAHIAGYPQGHYLCGVLKEEGLFSQQPDLNQAITFFYKPAAEKGVLSAQVKYAKFLKSINNLDDAQRYYKLAADRGHAGSQLELSSIFVAGKQWDEAVRYGGLAYTQNPNNPKYQLNFANALAQGYASVYRDNNELAFALYQEAVGSAIETSDKIAAYYNLAVCHRDGFGTDVDQDLALTNFLAAAKLGETDAATQMSEVYKSRAASANPVANDIEKAALLEKLLWVANDPFGNKQITALNGHYTVEFVVDNDHPENSGFQITHVLNVGDAEAAITVKYDEIATYSGNATSQEVVRILGLIENQKNHEENAAAARAARKQVKVTTPAQLVDLSVLEHAHKNGLRFYADGKVYRFFPRKGIHKTGPLIGTTKEGFYIKEIDADGNEIAGVDCYRASKTSGSIEVFKCGPDRSKKSATAQDGLIVQNLVSTIYGKTYFEKEEVAKVSSLLPSPAGEKYRFVHDRNEYECGYVVVDADAGTGYWSIKQTVGDEVYRLVAEGVDPDRKLKLQIKNGSNFDECTDPLRFRNFAPMVGLLGKAKERYEELFSKITDQQTREYSKTLVEERLKKNAEKIAEFKKFAQDNFAVLAASEDAKKRNLAGIFCELGIHEALAAGAAVAAPNLVQALAHYQVAANAGSLAAMDSVIRFYEEKRGIDSTVIGADKTALEKQFSQRAKVLKALKWEAESGNRVEYDETLKGYKVLSSDGVNVIAVVKSDGVFQSNGRAPLEGGFENQALVVRVSELEALQNVRKGYVAVPQELSESLLNAASQRPALATLSIDGANYTCSLDRGRFEIINPNGQSGYRVTFGKDKKPQVEKVTAKTLGRLAFGPSRFKYQDPKDEDHATFSTMIRSAHATMEADGGLIDRKKKEIIKAINGNENHDSLEAADSKTKALIELIKATLETRLPVELEREKEAKRIVENFLGLSGYFVDREGKVYFHASKIINVNKATLDVLSKFAVENYRSFVARKDEPAPLDHSPNDHVRLLGCEFADYDFFDGSREVSARNQAVIESMATRENNPNPIAQSRLAKIVSQQGKIDDARKLLDKATEAGYARAYLYLGDSCERDAGSRTLAYEAGANLGDVRSIFKAGMLYLSSRNSRKAVEYFKKGDALGHRPSIMQLARCYETVQGVDKDQNNPQKALELYEKAVIDLGYKDGILDLVRCYRQGIGCQKNEDMAKAIERMYYALQTGVKVGEYKVVGYDRDVGFRIKKEQEENEITVKIDDPNFSANAGVAAIAGTEQEIQRITRRKANDSWGITVETRGIVRFPKESVGNNEEVLRFAVDNDIEFAIGNKIYRLFQERDKPFVIRQIDQDGKPIDTEPYYRIDLTDPAKVFKESKNAGGASFGMMGTNADVSDDAIVANFFAQVVKLKDAKVRDVIDYRFLNSLRLVANLPTTAGDNLVAADFAVGSDQYRITKVAAYDQANARNNPSDIYQISGPDGDKTYQVVIPGNSAAEVKVQTYDNLSNSWVDCDYPGNDQAKILEVRALINSRGIDQAEKVTKAEVEYDKVVAGMDANVEYYDETTKWFFIKSPAVVQGGKPILHQYKRGADGLMIEHIIPNAANAANPADRVAKMAAVVAIDVRLKITSFGIQSLPKENSAVLGQAAIAVAPETNVKTTNHGAEVEEDISLLIMEVRPDEFEGKSPAASRELQSRFPVRKIDGVDRYTFSANGHDYCVDGLFQEEGGRTAPQVVTAGVISRIKRRENPRMLGSYSPFSQTFSDNAVAITDAFELVQLRNEFIRIKQQQRSRTELEGLVRTIKGLEVMATDPLADEKARQIVDGFFGISNERQKAMDLIASFNTHGRDNPVKAELERFCDAARNKRNKTSFDISFAASYQQNYPDQTSAARTAADKVAAVEEFLKAADLGNAHAQNNLGHIYENQEDFITAAYTAGVGTIIAAGTAAPSEEDRKKKAFEYYCAAARQGDVAGLENVARCYRNGVGVGKDETIADTLDTLIQNSNHQFDSEISHKILQYHPQRGFSIRDQNDNEISRVRIGEDGRVEAKKVVNGQEIDFTPNKRSGNRGDSIGSSGFTTIIKQITGDEEAKRIRNLAALGRVEDISNSLRDAIYTACSADGVSQQDAARVARLFCNIRTGDIRDPLHKPKHELLGSLSKAEQDVLLDFSRKYVSTFANSKNPQLQDLAGQIYFNGIGVQKDYAKAKSCFELAAGAKYGENADDTREISFKPEGYKMAQYHLGMMYLCGGSNLAKDDRNAFRCFKNAAGNVGSPKFAPAISTLAFCYLNGIGCQVNEARANDLYNSTNPGVNPTTAVSQVQQRLRSGNLADNEAALGVLVRIADKQPECYTEIGSLYEKGSRIATVTGSGAAAVVNFSLNINPSLAAAEQYRKGIEAGSPSAMRAMAQLHVAGKAVSGTTDRNPSYAKTLLRQADIFEACAISLGLEDNTITVQNGRSKANYKVSKSGTGYVISVDGKEQDGFKIKGDGTVYLLKKGKAELQENRKPEDGKKGTGLEDELLTKVLTQMVANNERSLARNTTGLEEKALLDLVGQLSKVEGMERSEAEYIARDFLGLASHQKGIAGVADNGGGMVIDNYHGNNHRVIGGRVREVLEVFAKSHAGFKDSPSAHLRNMYGVFCEMGLIEKRPDGFPNLEKAEESYKSAASMGYTPAEYNLANLKRSEDTTDSIDQAITLMAKLAKKKYFPAVKAYAEIIIADADLSRELARKSTAVQAGPRSDEIVEAARATKVLAWSAQSGNSVITIKSGQKDVSYKIKGYDREKGFTIERLNSDGTLSREGFRVGALHELNPGNFRFSTTGEVGQPLMDRTGPVPVAIESDLSKIIEHLEERMRAQDEEMNKFNNVRPSSSCRSAVARPFQQMGRFFSTSAPAVPTH